MLYKENKIAYFLLIFRVEYAIFLYLTFNVFKLYISMKRKILITLLIFSTGFIMGADYSKIDKKSGSVPQNLRTVKDITHYLTKSLNSPTDKARAIYYWIAHNISYDVAKMNSNATYTDPQQLIDEVLKTRKGVCANYSALFQACCQSAGVQSYIIDGYTRQYGKIMSLPHAWNAVKMNGRFYDIDATWASGYLNGNKYTRQFTDDFFMISPDEFIKTHMPFDPVWQFSNNPVTHKEFETGDFSSLTKESNFNYSDFIKKQSGLSIIEKLSGENQRIQKYGITNSMIRNKVIQNQQGINTEKFNNAANNFNAGVEMYNKYIRFKNKQFQNLTMKDEEILELLSSTRQFFELAEQTLSDTYPMSNDFNKSIQSMEKSIKGMKNNLDNEDKFISKYIKTSKPLRLLLFYKAKE